MALYYIFRVGCANNKGKLRFQSYLSQFGWGGRLLDARVGKKFVLGARFEPEDQSGVFLAGHQLVFD
jgi:hypothetical protein